MKPLRLVVLLVGTLCGFAAESAKAQQVVQITVSLDEGAILGELGLAAPFSSQLVGESAFFTFRTSSITSGGQLDGSAPFGNFIEFEEIFPEASLEDYLTFGYFGVLETRDGPDQRLSLVSTFRSGNYNDETTSLFFGFPNDDTLAETLNTVPNSPEFNLMANAFLNQQSSLTGLVGLPTIAAPRLGETLDVVAFIGGPGGNQARKIGELSVSVIPEPSTVATLVVFAVGMNLRRNLRRPDARRCRGIPAGS